MYVISVKLLLLSKEKLMAKDSSSDQVNGYYQALQRENDLRAEGALVEQVRIINLLLDLHVIRRAEGDRLVAFDTDGENVIYLTGLESK